MSTDPQNTKVQRYSLLAGYNGHDLFPRKTGSWVEHADYAILATQNTRLRELVKEMYYAMRRYEMDVDTEAPHTHRYMMTRADEVIHPDNFPTEKKGE